MKKFLICWVLITIFICCSFSVFAEEVIDSVDETVDVPEETPEQKNEEIPEETPENKEGAQEGDSTEDGGNSVKEGENPAGETTPTVTETEGNTENNGGGAVTEDNKKNGKEDKSKNGEGDAEDTKEETKPVKDSFLGEEKEVVIEKTQSEKIIDVIVFVGKILLCIVLWIFSIAVNRKRLRLKNSRLKNRNH